MKKRNIKHNDLTHYFLRPHSELPQAYLASCEEFFKSIKIKFTYLKPQASSKQQALDKRQATSYSRIIKEK